MSVGEDDQQKQAPLKNLCHFNTNNSSIEYNDWYFPTHTPPELETFSTLIKTNPELILCRFNVSHKSYY